jgi:hypothetical protein
MWKCPFCKAEATLTFAGDACIGCEKCLKPRVPLCAIAWEVWDSGVMVRCGIDYNHAADGAKARILFLSMLTLQEKIGLRIVSAGPVIGLTGHIVGRNGKVTERGITDHAEKGVIVYA